MHQQELYGDEDVSVCIKNTFLHVRRNRSNEDEDDESEQPSLLRATTDPARRFQIGEARPERKSHEKHDSEDTTPAEAKRSSMPRRKTEGAGVILLGRLIGPSRGDPAEKPSVSSDISTEGQGKRYIKPKPLRGLVPDSKRTTVMLRNLPNNYSRTMLLSLLDAEGFAGRYNFLYMPMDFRTHASLGYAFINMCTHDDAVEIQLVLEGFNKWAVPSNKVCSAGWSHPHQGLESHIARYRSSPLMHEAVPDEYRPILFLNGERIAFPPPTKKIKPPRQGTQRMLV